MLLPWILLIPSYQPLIIRYWDINWTLLMVVPIVISLTMISSVLCPLQIFRIETQAFFFFFFFFILQKKLLYSKRQILSVFLFFSFSLLHFCISSESVSGSLPVWLNTIGFPRLRKSCGVFFTRISCCAMQRFNSTQRSEMKADLQPCYTRTRSLPVRILWCFIVNHLRHV